MDEANAIASRAGSATVAARGHGPAGYIARASVSATKVGGPSLFWKGRKAGGISQGRHRLTAHGTGRDPAVKQPVETIKITCWVAIPVSACAAAVCPGIVLRWTWASRGLAGDRQGMGDGRPTCAGRCAPLLDYLAFCFWRSAR